MSRVLSIFGTRPEAIKMTPVVKALEKRQAESIVCVTSQHREMLASVLDVFSLKPDYDLDVMRPNQSLNGLLSRLLAGLDDVLATCRPDIVLVQGDTATCLAGALAAFQRGIDVGHIEAGLRTDDLARPFPEEGNRQMVSRIATWHFAPTEQAARRLKQEALPRPNIHVTGNTVIDALHMARDILAERPDRAYIAGLPPDYKPECRQYILVTGHRRESFGEGFLQICHALRHIAESHPELDIIYPVHLNPHVQQPVHAILDGLPNVYLLPPQDYLAFTRLLCHCRFVLTDSGGIQEEAPALGKPVLVMRDTTERPEGVAAGCSMLVGTRKESIVDGAKRLLQDSAFFQTMSHAVNPYGDGKAAHAICDIISWRDYE
jgi:UDP-N-acetylglucosamine 2-epimerase (non-hydrolysing)